MEYLDTDPETARNPLKTSVYRYGLLKPTINGDLVDQQILAAHKYQNKLIELELARRRARDEAIALDHRVAELNSRISAQEAALEAERRALSEQRSEARSRDAGSPAKAKEIISSLRDLWSQRKVTVKSALERSDIKAALSAANEEHRTSVREARGSSGVYWGTYLQIEAAVDSAAKNPTSPRFRLWTGAGAISVQLQKGLVVSALAECKDQRVRVTPLATPVPERRGKPLPRLLLRVGSDDKRCAVFAEWPIIFHRSMPETGIVKWVKVVRRRVAAHDKWSVHFTVQTPPASQPKELDGSILAVNVRWTRKPGSDETEEAIIAADWCDGATLGNIHVDQAVIWMIRKADDIRSIRVKNFDRIKEQFVAAKASLTLSEDHEERLFHLHTWRTASKLAAHQIWWRTHRFDSDSEIFAMVEAWRVQDKHLWEWEANARRKALARRRDSYRVFAAQMARSHRALVVEKLNIAHLAKIPKPDEERENNRSARSQRFDTSPSELRSALLNAFWREGARILEVPAGMSSAEMLAHFRKNGGDAITAPTARSQRFHRLRRIPKVSAA
jgi:hypothetical protein